MKRRRALLLTFSVVLALCTACGVWLHVQKQQYARNRQLIDALMRNDLKTALALVNAGADPNTPSDAPAADSLLQQFRRWLHPSPAPVYSSPTAFLLACTDELRQVYGENDHADWTVPQRTLVQAMLSHGANLHARDYDGSSALNCAVQFERLHVAEWLLQRGISVNTLDREGKTPLLYAVIEKNESMVRLLLAHHADPNAMPATGYSPLHYAVGLKCPASILQILLASGADPNQPGKNGSTPLTLAQERKRSDVVRLLKQHGTK